MMRWPVGHRGGMLNGWPKMPTAIVLEVTEILQRAKWLSLVKSIGGHGDRHDCMVEQRY